jgi:hypothetical protein
MKQTTEVSGNQTPEACSSLSGVSMRQACASPVPAQYYLREASQNKAELSHSTLPFLALRFHEKDQPLTPRLLRVWPILPLLGHILSDVCSMRPHIMVVVYHTDKTT